MTEEQINLIINDMTTQQARANLDSLGEKELILLNDVDIPLPTTEDSGKGIVVDENGQFALGTVGSGSADGAVLYNQTQTLTDEQKQIARENIGVTSSSTVSETVHITGSSETEINIPFEIGKKYNIQGNILRNSGINNCFHFYDSDGNSVPITGVWQSYLAGKSSNGSSSITSYFYYLSNDTTNNSMLIYDNNVNNQTTFVNINFFIRELDGKYCLQYNSKTSGVTFPNNNAGINQEHNVQGVFWCDTLPTKLTIVTATANVPYTYDLYIDEISAKSGSSSETDITDLQLNSTINSVEVIG